MTEKNAKEKSQRSDRSDSTALAIPNLGLPGIFEGFMKPFDEFMGPLFPGSTSSFWTGLDGKEPTMDFQDRGDSFAVTAELPGFDKKDVEVRISSDVLELKAEKKSEQQSKNGRERQSSYSFFHRYLSLPEQVVSEKVNGTMKNGILELELPKSEPKPKEVSRRVHLN
jgi:HSP20 family protein